MAQGGIYLFTGPDRDRKRQRVNQLAEALQVHPLDRHETSAIRLSATTLMACVREHPVASPVRLVVVDEAHRLDGTCLKALAEQADHLEQTACLILLVDVDLPVHHPFTLLKDKAGVEQFAWLSAHEVHQWVRRYASTHGKQITSDVLQELLQVYEADLAGLGAILDQLISWVGSTPQITQDDLRQFMPERVPTVGSTSGGRQARLPPQPADHSRRGGHDVRRGQAGGFALVEAVARRDAGSALHAVGEHRAAGKEVVELLGLLAWQLQRWLTVSHLVQAGVLHERIERITGLRPWQMERLMRELRGRPVAWLQRALHRCWELDVAAKTGRTIPWMALEGLVVELCLPAPAEAGSTAPVAA